MEPKVTDLRKTGESKRKDRGQRGRRGNKDPRNLKRETGERGLKEHERSPNVSEYCWNHYYGFRQWSDLRPGCVV